LIKKKQFNDTIEGLTIFVESKNENDIYKNIFIRDDSQILSNIGKISTIFAKSGYLNKDEKLLILYNGTIQKLNEDGNVNVVKFETTTLNLDGISAKSISDPKIQETSTINILSCLIYKYTNIHNCQQNKKSFMDNRIEINKRFGMPIFIPLISLVCAFLLSSRNDKKIYNYNKYIYFFVGFSMLTLSEIFVRYSGISWTHTAIYYLLPLGMLPVFYLILIRKFKYENLF